MKNVKFNLPDWDLLPGDALINFRTLPTRNSTEVAEVKESNIFSKEILEDGGESILETNFVFDGLIDELRKNLFLQRKSPGSAVVTNVTWKNIVLFQIGSVTYDSVPNSPFLNFVLTVETENEIEKILKWEDADLLTRGEDEPFSYFEHNFQEEPNDAAVFVSKFLIDVEGLTEKDRLDFDTHAL